MCNPAFNKVQIYGLPIKTYRSTYELTSLNGWIAGRIRRVPREPRRGVLALETVVNHYTSPPVSGRAVARTSLPSPLPADN